MDLTRQIPYVFRILDVHKVVDGDTLDMLIDTGFNNRTIQRFRLARIDTPELNDKNPELSSLAVLAKNILKEKMDAGFDALVHSEKDDAFGRWLGEIYLDGSSLNQYLLDEGYAIPWTTNKTKRRSLLMDLVARFKHERVYIE